jgi:glycogen(starch) synthase
MRIAVVTPEYPPDTIGGGGVVFQALVGEYITRHEVRVFTAADSDRSWVQSRRSETVDNLTINRYPLIPIGQGISYLRSAPPPNFPAWLQLRNDIADWSPNVAHVHGYGHAFIDLAAFILARRHVPFVFTLHGIPTRPARRNSLIRAAWRIYQRFGAARVIRKAHTVTAVSIAGAGFLARQMPIHVVPNGVSPMTTSDPQRVEQLRERLAISRKGCVIAGVGRLSIEKGFDVLIKALDHVQVPEFTCVIAGSDGGAEQELTELASKVRPGISVLLPGRLTKESVADLMAIADVVVVPSREESFGLVALEALASGKRLVASRIGGLGEFLNPGVAELVARDDVAALASGITRSLARGPLTPRELDDAQRVVTSHLWSVVARQYEHLMAQVAEAAAGAPSS